MLREKQTKKETNIGFPRTQEESEVCAVEESTQKAHTVTHAALLVERLWANPPMDSVRTDPWEMVELQLVGPGLGTSSSRLFQERHPVLFVTFFAPW